MFLRGELGFGGGLRGFFGICLRLTFILLSRLRLWLLSADLWVLLNFLLDALDFLGFDGAALPQALGGSLLFGFLFDVVAF